MKKSLLHLLYILYTFLQSSTTEQVTEDSLFKMSDDSETVMGYDGTLICPNRKKFCALIYYIESDIIPHMLSSFDEDLRMIPLQCTHTGILHHNAHVTMEGGDGILDENYEPQVTIYHDCWGGAFCDSCINQLRRAQDYLRRVHITTLWKMQSWNMTLDPLGYHPINSKIDEILRPYWFKDSKTDNKDLNDWIHGKEVFDRKHLLKDDSLRFDNDVPHYTLTPLIGIKG